MLYLIGTGLYYLNDLPSRAVNELKACDEIFLERYTNLTDISFLPELERITEKKIKLIGREDVESETLIQEAEDKRIALLVPGDPLAATTHFSLVQECRTRKIEVNIIHSSSIFSAVGETGLSLYKFGGTTSIPIYTENFKPESFFDVITRNLASGYHTLILLEVKDENDFVGPDKAAEIIKNIESKRNKNIINWNNAVAVSMLGSSEQKIIRMKNNEFGSVKPPCSLIITAELNKNEEEALNLLT